MTQIPIYQVDAFTAERFTGNPAAICPLESWLPDAVMQAIAAENNLAETAYFVAEGDSYRLRWFTPAVEVDLCGHATLASAHVLFRHLGHAGDTIRFETRSGTLNVTRDGDLLALDFPARPGTPVDLPAGLAEAMGKPPVEIYRAGGNFLLVYASQADVAGLAPDFRALKQVGAAQDDAGFIATASGGESGIDFVSRYFAPAHGIDEDPVTGSTHCTLTPYWARRLGKAALTARQISARGGTLHLTDRGARIGIAGRAVDYLQGVITV